jgi:putative redox protein
MSQESVKKALSDLIGAINGNPGAAKVVFRAATKLQQDVQCVANVRDFPPMVIDEPPELGGGDSGMNPVELVLVALGTCQEIMFSAYASFMGIKLDECSVDVKGYLDVRGLLGLDASVPPGYQHLSYETKIVSSASDEEVRKLIETVESHCPVMDILARAQNISGRAVVNGKELHSFTTMGKELEAA